MNAIAAILARMAASSLGLCPVGGARVPAHTDTAQRDAANTARAVEERALQTVDPELDSTNRPLPFPSEKSVKKNPKQLGRRGHTSRPSTPVGPVSAWHAEHVFVVLYSGTSTTVRLPDSAAL